jgi:7-cyano-7-deazaguanine tRNA-ribosyltransferase
LLNRYEQLFDTTVIFPEGNKPYSTCYSQHIKEILKKKNVNLVVHSHLGPVPIELDEMYPFAQSVFPKNIDKETDEESRKILDEFLKGKKVILWKESATKLETAVIKERKTDMDLKRISAVADMQFGKNASKALFFGDIKIVKSKKTGKIRNIYCDEQHILSMRASDGLFTLKIKGAQLLHTYFKHPKLRVTVENDAISFIKEGKSVFAKFVKDADPKLSPLDECLIVDEKDNLLSVGRCLLNRMEMTSFNYGMAVKTRESIDDVF